MTYVATCPTLATAAGASTLHIRYKSVGTYTRLVWINGAAITVTYPNTNGIYNTLNVPVTLTTTTTLQFDLSYLWLDNYDVVGP